MSPSTPKVSSKTTIVVAKAALIHVSSAPEMLKSCWKVPFRAPGSEYATWATMTARHAATRVAT